MTNGHLARAAGTSTARSALDHRRRARPASCCPPASAARCSSSPPIIPSSTTRGTSSRGRPASAGSCSTPSAVEVVERGPLVGAGARATVVRPSSATVTYDAARRQRRGSTSTSTSTGTRTSSCCRWRSRSTCAPTTAACDIQFGARASPDPPVELVGRRQVRGVRAPLRRRRRADFGVAVLNDGRYGHGLFDGGVRVSLARAATVPRPRRRPRRSTGRPSPCSPTAPACTSARRGRAR